MSPAEEDDGAGTPDGSQGNLSPSPADEEEVALGQEEAENAQGEDGDTADSVGQHAEWERHQSAYAISVKMSPFFVEWKNMEA